MNWEKLRLQVIERDKHTCQICLKIMSDLDVHHIIPRHRKGLDSMNNLTSVCEDCHWLIELKRPPNYCPSYKDPTKPEFVKVRKPGMLIQIPISIKKHLSLEKGDTFAMYTEGDNKIVLVKATI